MKAIVIGAGIGGLAVSIRLAQKGYDVEVYEANTYPGGKLSEIRSENGFRFDAGPSLFTMPFYVDELFELCGEQPGDTFQHEELDIVCNYFWEDGTRLSAYSEKEKLYHEIEEQLGINPNRFRAAMDDSRIKYELTGRIFLERPLHLVKSWLSWDVLKAIFQIYKLDIFKSMHDVNKQLLRHPKLVQFFDRFATYNGSNPYQASGILNIIPHFEHHFGAHFPKGGMISITKGLHQLAIRQGVQFHFGQKVERIIIENEEAVGISVSGAIKSADIVISNMDIYPTYKKLLPQQKAPSAVFENERSSSALIFYWGIDKTFPELDLHNIFFSDHYKAEFESIAAGGIHEDPTVYINISSKYHPKDAPEGCENWFTMINVPYNDGQDWDNLIQSARKNIIRKVSRILGEDIEKHIIFEDILDPRKIELRTSSHAGALYGTASNDRMAAFKRHANFSSSVKNLYFCGGSVHPGGGIPLCLLSAKMVEQVVR